MKKCIFPKCTKILSRYNHQKFCFFHQRVILQNGLKRIKGKYYRIFSVASNLYKIKKQRPLTVKELVSLPGHPIVSSIDVILDQ
jgi:hypothetical protein